MSFFLEILPQWLNFLAEIAIIYILVLEYKYDFNKDIEKKQKRTRTTKKTTTHKDGSNVQEESVETVEPITGGN